MSRKKKGRSTQELMGIQNFTRYGLATSRGELLFFLVSPTNISVLSRHRDHLHRLLRVF